MIAVLRKRHAAMAQLVEHILGKDEVPGPNPGSSSKTPYGHLSIGYFVLERLSRIRDGSR